MRNFNKNIFMGLLLSGLLFVAGKINAKAGVYVENRTGKDIYAQIDFGTEGNWKEIKDVGKDEKTEIDFLYKRNDSSFLPSESSGLKVVPRKVYFKIPTGDKTFLYYMTDEYNYPDQITILYDPKKLSSTDKPRYEYKMKTTTYTDSEKGLKRIELSELSKKIKQSTKIDFEKKKKESLEKIAKIKTLDELHKALESQKKVLDDEKINKASKEEIKYEEDIKKALQEKFDSMLKKELTLYFAPSKGVGVNKAKEAQNEKDIIKKFKEFKLDPNYKLGDNYIISLAISKGFVNLFNYLIEQKDLQINVSNSVGQTPLHYAVTYRKNFNDKDITKVLEAIVKKGINLNAKSKYNETAMDLIKLTDPSGTSPVYKYLAEKMGLAKKEK